MQQLNSTLEILLARFNGQVLIPFAPASKSVGIPEQTARNRLVSGNFPIPTVLNGSRRFIHIADLASYVDSLRGINKPKRGRKTKAKTSISSNKRPRFFPYLNELMSVQQLLGGLSRASTFRAIGTGRCRFSM